MVNSEVKFKQNSYDFADLLSYLQRLQVDHMVVADRKLLYECVDSDVAANHVKQSFVQILCQSPSTAGFRLNFDERVGTFTVDAEVFVSITRQNLMIIVLAKSLHFEHGASVAASLQFCVYQRDHCLGEFKRFDRRFPPTDEVMYENHAFARLVGRKAILIEREVFVIINALLEAVHGPFESQHDSE
jgi:hypothetical protein